MNFEPGLIGGVAPVMGGSIPHSMGRALSRSDAVCSNARTYSGALHPE